MGNIMDDWFGIEAPKPPQPAPVANTAAQQQQFNQQQAELQRQYNLDTAKVQSQYNLDALRTNISANRLNQNTPFGSLTYNQSGTDPFGNPTYTATSSLSPENQALLEQLQANRGSIGGIAGNLAESILGSSIYGSAQPDLTSAIQPMMDRQLDYLDPYFKQQLDNRIAELRNRGLEAGNPAYDYEINALMQQQDRSVGNYLNTFTNTAMDLYKMPINALASIMGIGTGPVMGADGGLGLVTPPSANMGSPTVGSPTVGNVNFGEMQNQYQNALNELYKQQMGQYNSNMSAIGTGISTILGAPSGTLLGGITGAAGGGLAGMLGLQNGNTPMRIM